MSFFGIDPHSIAGRAKASAQPVRVPTLLKSIVRGSLGFMFVSVAGFLPWVLAGRWFYRNPSEGGMYAACAAVFIVTSGIALHPLLISPGSVKRFYQFFGVAFAGYAAFWIVGWMGTRGLTMHTRSVIGLLAGTLVMAVVFATAFDAWRAFPIVAAALFVLNSIGYFVGGWIEGSLNAMKEFNLLGISLSGAPLHAFMKIMWGVCYGLGFGAGLGIAFYVCQAETRKLIAANAAASA